MSISRNAGARTFIGGSAWEGASNRAASLFWVLGFVSNLDTLSGSSSAGCLSLTKPDSPKSSFVSCRVNPLKTHDCIMHAACENAVWMLGLWHDCLVNDTCCQWRNNLKWIAESQDTHPCNWNNNQLASHVEQTSIWLDAFGLYESGVPLCQNRNEALAEEHHFSLPSSIFCHGRGSAVGRCPLELLSCPQQKEDCWVVGRRGMTPRIVASTRPAKFTSWEEKIWRHFCFCLRWDREISGSENLLACFITAREHTHTCCVLSVNSCRHCFHDLHWADSTWSRCHINRF